jgi:hypothetical protein
MKLPFDLGDTGCPGSVRGIQVVTYPEQSRGKPRPPDPAGGLGDLGGHSVHELSERGLVLRLHPLGQIGRSIRRSYPYPGAVVVGVVVGDGVAIS